MHRMLIAVLVLLALSPHPVAQAADIVDWQPLTKTPLGPGDRRYFDMAYNEGWARDVLAELGANDPGRFPSRGDHARVLRETLAEKLGTTRAVALAQPPAPQWLIDGYDSFQPRSVARSRWMDDVISGAGGRAQVNPKVKAERDIAALFAYYCIYDAEWFNASRSGAFKAWLTALQLSYPADWQRLDRESKDALHRRLVAPLQTPDEPYREIDNWITALKNNDAGFAKPLVRRALVEELLMRGGYSPPGRDGKPKELDPRLFEDPAYKAGAPAGLGLSDREFFLLAALCTEFAGELHMLDPDMPQLKPFADYFISAFERAR